MHYDSISNEIRNKIFDEVLEADSGVHLIAFDESKYPDICPKCLNILIGEFEHVLFVNDNVVALAESLQIDPERYNEISDKIWDFNLIEDAINYAKTLPQNEQALGYAMISINPRGYDSEQNEECDHEHGKCDHDHNLR